MVKTCIIKLILTKPVLKVTITRLCIKMSHGGDSDSERIEQFDSNFARSFIFTRE